LATQAACSFLDSSRGNGGRLSKFFTLLASALLPARLLQQPLLPLSVAAAFATASRLLDEEQDVLASLLMAEMDRGERWNTLFSQSQGLLADLAKQALGEHEVDQAAEV
jgi:hypothetical protein